MEMNGVLESFRTLLDGPWLWVILAAATLRVAWSVYVYFHCPVLHHVDRLDPEVARQATESPHIGSPRFLVVMLAGVAMATIGLYALREPEVGPPALAAILFGSYLLIVGPARLSVEENTRRAAASRLQDAEAQAFAHERLLAAHLERIATEVALALGLGALILVY